MAHGPRQKAMVFIEGNQQMAVLLAEVEREIARQAAMAAGATGTKLAATAGNGVAIAGNAGLSGAAAGTGTQAISAGGTIWTGKGLSLGLGLGLGAWGPVLVIAAAAAAGYAYLQYRQRQLGTDEEIEQSVEADEGFYPTQG